MIITNNSTLIGESILVYFKNKFSNPKISTRSIRPYLIAKSILNPSLLRINSVPSLYLQSVHEVISSVDDSEINERLVIGIRGKNHEDDIPWRNLGLFGGSSDKNPIMGAFYANIYYAPDKKYVHLRIISDPPKTFFFPKVSMNENHGFVRYAIIYDKFPVAAIEHIKIDTKNIENSCNQIRKRIQLLKSCCNITNDVSDEEILEIINHHVVYEKLNKVYKG